MRATFEISVKPSRRAPWWKIRFAAAACFFMLSFAALGQTTTWTCTYPNFLGETIIERYRVVGNEVVDEDARGRTIHFKILQNNEYGLVAVFSQSSIGPLLFDPTHKGPIIEAFLLLIDKGTREMKYDVLVMGDKHPVLPTSGTCIPG